MFNTNTSMVEKIEKHFKKAKCPCGASLEYTIKEIVKRDILGGTPGMNWREQEIVLYCPFCCGGKQKINVSDRSPFLEVDALLILHRYKRAHEKAYGRKK